jgi:hypothetical protein
MYAKQEDTQLNTRQYSLLYSQTVLGILKNGDTIGWQLWLSASKSLA